MQINYKALLLSILIIFPVISGPVFVDAYYDDYGSYDSYGYSDYGAYDSFGYDSYYSDYGAYDMGMGNYYDSYGSYDNYYNDYNYYDTYFNDYNVYDSYDYGNGSNYYSDYNYYDTYFNDYNTYDSYGYDNYYSDYNAYDNYSYADNYYNDYNAYDNYSYADNYYNNYNAYDNYGYVDNYYDSYGNYDNYNYYNDYNYRDGYNYYSDSYNQYGNYGYGNCFGGTCGSSYGYSTNYVDWISGNFFYIQRPTIQRPVVQPAIRYTQPVGTRIIRETVVEPVVIEKTVYIPQIVERPIYIPQRIVETVYVPQPVITPVVVSTPMTQVLGTSTVYEAVSESCGGLILSILAKSEVNPKDWQESLEGLKDTKIDFMIIVVNSSQETLEDITVKAEIPVEIEYIGDLNSEGDFYSGDIRDGIKIGSLTANSVKTITFTGKIDTNLSGELFVNGNVESGEYFASDSVTVVVGEISNTAAVGENAKNIFQKWYLLGLALLIIVGTFMIFRRMFSA